MSDLIQIVNDNDELIGHKERSEVSPTQDTYRSSAIWVENSKGEVLLAQRKWTRDKDPGKWGPAASGTVNKGETYESNAHKELEEELGLSGIKLTMSEKFKRTVPRRHFVQTFKAVADVPVAQLKLQETEVEQAKWISKQELIHDSQAHPEKYIPAMSDLLRIFIS